MAWVIRSGHCDWLRNIIRAIECSGILASCLWASDIKIFAKPKCYATQPVRRCTRNCELNLRIAMSLFKPPAYLKHIPPREILLREYERLVSVRRHMIPWLIGAMIVFASWVFASIYWGIWSPWSWVMVACNLFLLLLPCMIWARPDWVYRWSISRLLPDLTPEEQGYRDRYLSALRTAPRHTIQAVEVQ